MKDVVPPQDFGVAVKEFFLGCLIGPLAAFILIHVATFVAYIASLTVYRTFLDVVWREPFGFLMATYVFGIIPAGLSSVICTSYLYNKKPPSVWIAIVSTLPFSLFCGFNLSPYTSGFLYKLLAFFVFSGLLALPAAISWFVIRWIMNKMYMKNDPLHPHL